MYIPDLTERYPEGFRAVDEAERLDDDRRDMWVSFYLQDGTQGMATISARDYDDATTQMMKEYGDMFGEIVDYEFYDAWD
jgi:hypothetical protein